MKWLTFAGGVCASNKKYSYVSRTSIGTYYISPVSYALNADRHRGYKVQFANDKGLLSDGLWIYLTVDLVNLKQAKRKCWEHFQNNKHLEGSCDTK